MCHLVSDKYVSMVCNFAPTFSKFGALPVDPRKSYNIIIVGAKL